MANGLAVELKCPSKTYAFWLFCCPFTKYVQQVQKVLIVYVTLVFACFCARARVYRQHNPVDTGPRLSLSRYSEVHRGMYDPVSGLVMFEAHDVRVFLEGKTSTYIRTYIGGWLAKAFSASPGRTHKPTHHAHR